MKIKDKKPIIVGVIMMMTAQLGTNFYIIVLPIIAAYYRISEAVALNTIYFYLVSYGISQLFVAPYINRFGFKTSALFGFLMFGLGVVILLNAPNIIVFGLGRIVQGIGGSTLYVIIRMLIQKNYIGVETNIAFSIVESFAVLTPALAPIFGAYVVTFFPWQSLFYIMMFAAFVAAFVISRLVKDERIKPTPKLGVIFANYFSLIKNLHYTRLLCVTAFCFAPIVFSLSVLPFILGQIFNLQPSQYSFIVGFTIFGSFFGSFLSKKANEKGFKNLAVRVAIFIMLFAGFMLYLSWFFQLYFLSTFIANIMFIFFAYGIIFPNAMADSFKQVTHKTGAEVALFGFFQVSIGSIFNLIVTRIWQKPEEGMFVIAILSAILIFFLYKLPEEAKN